jgi:hypothetical protein
MPAIVGAQQSSHAGRPLHEVLQQLRAAHSAYHQLYLPCQTSSEVQAPAEASVALNVVLDQGYVAHSEGEVRAQMPKAGPAASAVLAPDGHRCSACGAVTWPALSATAAQCQQPHQSIVHAASSPYSHQQRCTVPPMARYRPQRMTCAGLLALTTTSKPLPLPPPAQAVTGWTQATLWCWTGCAARARGRSCWSG